MVLNCKSDSLEKLLASSCVAQTLGRSMCKTIGLVVLKYLTLVCSIIIVMAPHLHIEKRLHKRGYIKKGYI